MIFSRFRCAFCATAIILFADTAFAAKIVSCRGEPGSVKFLDAKGRGVKSFTNKETRKDKGDSVTYDIVRVYGCLRGRFAYIIHQYGTCPTDGEDCSETHTVLEIFDHTGKKSWVEEIPLTDNDEVVVARSDDRVLFAPRVPPFGVVAIEPNGNKRRVVFESGKGGSLFNNEISPNGRYGIARLARNMVFFDVITGRTHEYKGPGSPWVNDEGKFEVWTGSSLKNDFSRGPDGQKVYTFKFE